MPGSDFTESAKLVLDTLTLPYVPELPARGAIAAMIGRTLAMIGELGFDLQPAGWRLTDAPGVDHRRARSLLAQDLDTFEELAQAYAGPLKIQLVGPWTLAAAVERPRGDKVLADVGARRELAQALALGAQEHLADVRRRVPGATVVVQVDEPALPFVMAGRVPTASGFHRHRSVDPPRASELLEELLGAVADSGPIVHCCAAEPPIGLLRGAGAAGVSVDLTVLGAGEYDALGGLLDDGGRLFIGVVPSVGPGTTTSDVLNKVRRFLDMLGLDPAEVTDQLVITPTCGLAGATTTYSRAALRQARESGDELA